jgi:hypothetical protein
MQNATDSKVKLVESIKNKKRAEIVVFEGNRI